METSLVERGWLLPLNLSQQPHLVNRAMHDPARRQQLVTLTDETTEIEQAIRIILLTVPGERVMRPNFGCRLNELVFEPNNRATAVQAERYVTEALTQWEPRIALRQIDATPSKPTANRSAILITVTYVIKETGAEQTLVYPFYLIPGE